MQKSNRIQTALHAADHICMQHSYATPGKLSAKQGWGEGVLQHLDRALKCQCQCLLRHPQIGVEGKDGEVPSFPAGPVVPPASYCCSPARCLACSLGVAVLLANLPPPGYSVPLLESSCPSPALSLLSWCSVLLSTARGKDNRWKFLASCSIRWKVKKRETRGGWDTIPHLGITPWGSLTNPGPHFLWHHHHCQLPAQRDAIYAAERLFIVRLTSKQSPSSKLVASNAGAKLQTCGITHRLDEAPQGCSLVVFVNAFCNCDFKWIQYWWKVLACQSGDFSALFSHRYSEHGQQPGMLPLHCVLPIYLSPRWIISWIE